LGFVKHLAFDIIHISANYFLPFKKFWKAKGGKIIETQGDGLYAMFGYEMNRMQTVKSAVQFGFCILGRPEGFK